MPTQPLDRIVDPRLRATLDTVHDAVIVIDARGVVIDANRAVHTILGHEPEGLVGRNVSVLMEEPDRSRHHDYVSRYLVTREGVIIGRGREVLGKHTDGRLVPVELAVSPFEIDGEVYFCGTLRDLSAQKLAEAERTVALRALEAQHAILRDVLEERTRRLDTSEQFHHSVFDALSPRVAVLDETLRMVLVNAAWRRLIVDVGLPEALAIEGASYEDVLDHATLRGDAEAGAVKAGLRALLAGEVAELVHPFPCRPGRDRCFVLRATRFACVRGVFVVAAHEDVTEGRLAHDELARREAILRAVIETAPDAVAIVDHEERVEFVGKTLCQLPAEIVGRSLTELLEPEELAARRRAWARALETDDVVAYEAAGPPRAGLAGRTLTVRVRALRLPQRPPKLLFFATDVTDRRRAEAELAASQDQLRQAQKMEAIGQLAGGMAHDFNNLLTAIRYHVSFALAQLEAEDPAATEMRHIEHATERAAELTSQLLAFSRGHATEPTLIDLGPLAEEVLPMLRRLVGSRIRIDTHFHADARWIKADRGQLLQVLTNLVVNARDAIADTGSVSIETRRHLDDQRRDWVTLSVTDDGAGMAPEVQSRAFEPFFTTKPTGRGTGLGLAMVYGIVTNSGGLIGLSSEVGRGTRFELRFPRFEGSEPAVAPAPPARARRPGAVAGARLLLVEDDVILRNAAERALGSEGYRVIATNAVEALRTLDDASEHIDILVTDVVMPDVTGTELVRHARRTRPGLRALLLSGFAAAHLRTADLADLAFLAKPFSPEELLAKVRAVLAGEPTD